MFVDKSRTTNRKLLMTVKVSVLYWQNKDLERATEAVAVKSENIIAQSAVKEKGIQNKGEF